MMTDSGNNDRLEIDPGKEFGVIKIPESSESRQLRFAEIRKQAKQRIDGFMNPSDEMRQGDMRRYILAAYNDDETFDELSPSQITNLCMAHVAHDFLIIEMLNPEGTPSELSQAQGHDIDPDDYKYVGSEWNEYKEALRKRLKDELNPDSWVGQVGVKVDANDPDFYNRDLVETFVNTFRRPGGKPYLVVIPGTVYVDKHQVSIHAQEGFIPPYGGIYAARTVFVPVEP